MSETRHEFNSEEARRIGEEIGIDWASAPFDVDQFRIGMHVELEHGLHDPLTIVSDDDPHITAKIALAHVNEFMANGARMEGIEADLFFTFFGLDAIRKDRYEKVEVATVGNPGLHLPTWLGALPGFSALATKMMQRQMEKIDIPPIPEFIELVADSGVHLYACKASVDMFGPTMEDFVPQVEDIISVGEFYEKAADGQIIFT
jgi:peroxiredoxin family protein